MDHPPHINTKRPARRLSGGDVVEATLGGRRGEENFARLVSLRFVLGNSLHERTRGQSGVAGLENTDVPSRIFLGIFGGNWSCRSVSFGSCYSRARQFRSYLVVSVPKFSERGMFSPDAYSRRADFSGRDVAQG